MFAPRQRSRSPVEKMPPALSLNFRQRAFVAPRHLTAQERTPAVVARAALGPLALQRGVTPRTLQLLSLGVTFLLITGHCLEQEGVRVWNRYAPLKLWKLIAIDLLTLGIEYLKHR